MKKRLLTLVVVVCAVASAAAQSKSQTRDSLALHPQAHYQWEGSDAKNRNIHRYYVGAGVGASYTQSSFGGVGVGAQMYGGMEFSRLISAELSLGYLGANTTAAEGNKNLYYASGKYYYAPVAGQRSYKYADLKSAVNIFSLGATVNFDILSIWNNTSPWRVLLSPEIGVAYSQANIKNTGSVIAGGNAVHFTAGIDVTGVYSLSEKWGLRLRVGADYLTGKAFDAIPQVENVPNYILSSQFSVIYKF